MVSNNAKKDLAISLRKEGKTYSEILKVVHVTKSTLSLWLRAVGLSKTQKQKITQARLLSGLRGAQRRHEQRVFTQVQVHSQAISEIKNISSAELFYIGVTLYWAEGNKERIGRPGSQLMFSNMDPKMIVVFLNWLLVSMCISSEDIFYEIYVHKNHIYRKYEIVGYWKKWTAFCKSNDFRVYVKNTNAVTNRKNTREETYFGILRIRVRKSSHCVRKLAGWADGIYDAVVPV